MWITGAELARAAGLTPQTIHNMERQRLVVTRPARRGGKKEYDVDASVSRILKDPKTRFKDKVRAAYGNWCAARGRAPFWEEEEPDDDPAEDSEEDESEDWSLEEAKRRKEIYAAKLEKLKFQKEAGKYIEADVAQAAMEDIGIRFQKAIMNIPDRISAVIAAERDAFQVQRLLEQEFRLTLQGFVNELARAAPA